MSEDSFRARQRTRGRGRVWLGAAAVALMVLRPSLAAAPEDGGTARTVNDQHSENWAARELRRFLSYPFLDKAYRLLKAGETEQARLHVRRALELDPDNVAIEYQSLALLSELDDHDAVVELAAKLLRQRPADGMALLYRGRANARQGKVAEALADLSSAVAGDHLDAAHAAEARGTMVDVAIGAGRYDLAIGILREKGTGDGYRDPLRLGMALAALGRSAEALPAFAEALANARDAASVAEAARASAFAALATDDVATAQLAVDRGLEAAPGDRALIGIDASLKERAGQVGPAADQYARSLPEQPSAAELARLGRLRLAAGRFDAACEAAELGLAAAPDLAAQNQLRLVLARGKLGLQRQEEAAAEIAKLVQPDPSLVLEWAAALESSDRAAEALAVLQTLPEDTDLRQRRATLYERLGQIDLAIRQIEPLSTDGAPEQRAATAYRLGMLQLKAGRKDAARDAFKRAAELDPGRQDYLMALAEMLIETEDYADAHATLSSVLAIKPDPALRLRLAEVEIRMGDESVAAASLERLADLQPPGDSVRVEALTRLGYLAARAGQPQRAAKAMEAAFKEGGSANLALLRAAVNELVKANDLDRALSLIQLLLTPDRQAAVN